MLSLLPKILSWLVEKQTPVSSNDKKKSCPETLFYEKSPSGNGIKKEFIFIPALPIGILTLDLPKLQKGSVCTPVHVERESNLGDGSYYSIKWMLRAPIQTHLDQLHKTRDIIDVFV
jgi:hypothetical protein